MKKLFLALMFLAGCKQIGNSPAPVACWKLDMCEVSVNGSYGEGPYWPSFTVYCVYGYDAKGQKTGDVKRFFARDALSAWSILHPEAKNCEQQ